ncbi:MAG: hypothetical protein V4631_15785 [Pseudomonadota bacterium]
MKQLARLVCIIAAAGAALPLAASAQTDDIARVEVRRHIPLLSACPQAMLELPASLSKSWREIDVPADVLVDIKLEGTKVTDVKVKGGQGDYDGLVRRAAKSMTCATPSEGPYAARFRIKFRYDDEQATNTAMKLSDETPSIAAR